MYRINFSYIFKARKAYFINRCKSYKNTLNFPKFALPIKIKPANDATDIYNYLYTLIKPSSGDRHFCLHDGPPYANGNPHVGHALNKILKDVVLHYKRLQGFAVAFRPGWDCHGLPIEMKSAETRLDCVTDVRRTACDIANKYIGVQKTAFRSWGVAADWDSHYATFQPAYQSRQIQAFDILQRRSLIFRDVLPIYWSCSSRTALAEAELEYNDRHCSDSMFVRLRLLPGGVGDRVSLLVWTTTPWTLVANEAVAVRPDMRYLLCADDAHSSSVIIGAPLLQSVRAATNRRFDVLAELSGAELVQWRYRHPIRRDKTCPVVAAAADMVTADKGTGLVHVAPAHGKDDFQLLRARGDIDWQEAVFVDEAGSYTDLCGPALTGLDALTTGHDAVVAMLGDDVLHRAPFVHNYPYDWRSKKPVIVRLSAQWFLDVAQLSQQALRQYEAVRVYPPAMKPAMLQFIANRPNWCISRQRKWGVPIPVLYDHTDRPIVDSDFIDHIAHRVSREGSDFWWTDDLDAIVPRHLLDKWRLDRSQVRKSADIFDIWFDSGLSWWCSMPAGDIDVYLEGLDQFRGWFSASLLTGVALKGTSPYKSVVCHGFVVDSAGRKMSKSVGNVIDPAAIANKYGVDVLRYWACSAPLTGHSSISGPILDQIEKKYFSIRNLFRFVLGNISADHKLADFCDRSVYESLLPQDRYILHLLRNKVDKIASFIDSYQFDQIMIGVEEIESKISNFYFTIIKDRLYCDNVLSKSYQSCVTTLTLILNSLIPVCLPLFPCLLDEVVASLKQSNMISEKPNICWPQHIGHWVDEDVVQAMEQLILPLRNEINAVDFLQAGIVLSNQTNPMSELSLEIFVRDSQARSVLESFNNHSVDWESVSPLSEILRCASVKISSGDMATQSTGSVGSFIELGKGQCTVAFTKHDSKQKCSRCRRYINLSGEGDCCVRCVDAMATLSSAESGRPCAMDS